MVVIGIIQQVHAMRKLKVKNIELKERFNERLDLMYDHEVNERLSTTKIFNYLEQNAVK